MTTHAVSPHHERLRELHGEPAIGLTKNTLDTLALFTFSGLALAAINLGWWPLALPAWAIAAHFALTKPLAFHEAAHGTFDRRPLVNEAFGHFAGWIIGVPLPVFRYAHTLHHARIATPDDPELWPFTLTQAPRSLRLASAFVEIVFGVTYAPLLFLRSVLVAKKLPRKLKRSMVVGYLGCVALWSAVFGLVAFFGVAREFLILYAAPVSLAAVYRTLQKFTEHLGLFSNSLLGLSRTVACKNTLGQAISASLHHEHHHGAHHRYAKIPYRNLPEATELIYDSVAENETGPVFSTYSAALWDMLKSLGNPRVGPQWAALEQRSAAPKSTSAKSRQAA